MSVEWMVWVVSSQEYEMADQPILDLPAAPETHANERGHATREEPNGAPPPGENGAGSMVDAGAALSETGPARVGCEEGKENASKGRPDAAAVAAGIGGDGHGLPDGPIGMYLRDTVRISPLIREGEGEIAKRIETGRRAMPEGLRKNLLTARTVVAWRDETRAGSLAPSDVADVESAHASELGQESWQPEPPARALRQIEAKALRKLKQPSRARARKPAKHPHPQPCTVCPFGACSLFFRTSVPILA